MEKMLNGQTPEIREEVIENGKTKTVVDKEATIAIRDKQNTLNETFKKWIFDDPERRATLTAKYNRLFNSERAREYNGSFLRFAGMNPEYKLRKHQKDAVARTLFGGNTLFGHCVGAGKTFTMAASAMEMRRRGMARKPCFVVPNHIVGQWTNEFHELYPGANILTATQKDFTKSKRKLFMAKIVTGDWDAVIIPQSFFERMPVSQERQEAKLRSEIAQARSYLDEVKDKKNSNFRKRQMESSLKRLVTKLEKLMNATKDDLITFEDTGIDALFVDEAHYYKNKNIFSKKSHIAGLVLNSDTKRVKDMEMKIEYINDINHGEKNVILATGTPISNSMAELYTMQSYLQPKKLKEMGHHHFDNWSNDHGKVVTQVELAPNGTSYRTKERFSQFNNVQQLMNTFRMVADIKTLDMLDLPVPILKGSKPTTIAVEASKAQTELVKALVKVSELVKDRILPLEIYNMLVLTHHGSLGALDMRTLDINDFKRLEAYIKAKNPNENLDIDFNKLQASDNPTGKVNTCVEKVYEIYKSTTEPTIDSKGIKTEGKLTQMIFCDSSTPKDDGSFSVYNDIKEKLIIKGVPANEIVFIHDAKSNEEKEKIFAKMRTGEIRVLLGSTSKMGTGTNAQRLLVALHNLDAPWRPSDLEQRSGRILRQGNLNKEVEIFNYVTKNTFDAYRWQIIEGKQRYISQVMSGKIEANSITEADMHVLNYAEVKAIASGNPAIKLKSELEAELARIKVLEKQYLATRYQNQDMITTVLPNQIALKEGFIKSIAADTITRDKHTNKGFKMQIGKNQYNDLNDKKLAGELLLKAAASTRYTDQVIGIYKDFKIIPKAKSTLLEPTTIILQGATRHYIELGDSGIGAITRIDNALAKFNDNHKIANEQLIEIRQQLNATKEVVNTPFEHRLELEAVQSKLSAVNAELNIGKDNSVIMGETNEGEAIVSGIIDIERDDEEQGITATKKEDLDMEL